MYGLYELLSLLSDFLVFILIYVIVVVALNLQFGYTGIPNFGLVMSVAIGAYVTGALAGRILMMYYGITNMDFIRDNPSVTALINENLKSEPLISILTLTIVFAAALLAGALIGFIASRPAIRLKTDYLLMFLLAMAEGVRSFARSYKPLVGGTLFVYVPDLLGWLGKYKMLGLLLLALMVTVIVFVYVEFIVRSPYGRLIRAIRENEIAAECLGKDVVKVKTQIFVIGSMIASLAGVIFSLYTGVVVANAYRGTDWTFWPWLMAMMGGLGNNFGALAGAVSMSIMRRLIYMYKHQLEAVIPVDMIWMEQVLLGVALILTAMFLPRGIFPEKPTRIRGIPQSLIRKLINKIQSKRNKQ